MDTNANQTSNETVNMLIEFAQKIEKLTSPLDQYKKDKIAKIKEILGVKIESNSLTILCSPLLKEQFKSSFSDVVRVHEDKNLKGYAYIVFDNSISELNKRQEIEVFGSDTNRFFGINMKGIPNIA